VIIKQISVASGTVALLIKSYDKVISRIQSLFDLLPFSQCDDNVWALGLGVPAGTVH